MYGFSRTIGGFEADLTKAIEETENEVFNPTVWVFEEAQNLIPSSALRSQDYQGISRYVTQGRNFNRSYIAITQRLASIDTNLTEISGLRFWGKQSGENALRKAKAYLPRDIARQLPSLAVGQFFKQGDTIDLIQTQPFVQYVKPRDYRPIMEELRAQAQTYREPLRYPTRNPSFLERAIAKILGA